MPVRGRFPRRRARHGHERLSELLDRLAHEDDSERIAFGGLLEAVGERAFGALILVFSIPGRHGGSHSRDLHPAGPAPAAAFDSTRNRVATPMAPTVGQCAIPGTQRSSLELWSTVRPRLQRFEKLLKPRLLVLTSTWAERGTGRRRPTGSR